MLNFMEKSVDYYPCFHPSLSKCSCGIHLLSDRISSLPVEVLLTILSFLPLKEMVKTSILSTGWLDLWVNTHVLDFHHGLVGYDDEKHNKFVKLVNHVLQQHKGLYLKKFRICYTIPKDFQEDIDRWLEFALAKKVEILELDFTHAGVSYHQHYNYVFSDHWFSNGKDNVHCSKSGALQYNLKFLKSLSLKSINITGEAINFFLRNCPFLERLEVVGSNRLVNLVISDPTLVLKYLQIRFCYKIKVMSIANFKLVSLDTTFGDVILKDLPMLVELSILGYRNSLRHTLSQNANCLRQLKCLDLDESNLEKFAELPSILAQLTKLKRLVIRYVARFDESLTTLIYVINSCNHLEEFVLELVWTNPARLRTSMQIVKRLSCEKLKLFEFKGYYGRVSDVELIMHVVKNAPRLEKIIIDAWDIALRKMNGPVRTSEHEARRYALMQFKDLTESQHIPQHVDVYINRHIYRHMLMHV